jgi:GAF domain-containing protein
MTKVPIPEHESERLAALREYRILDTEAEHTYDDIVTLAAQVCEVPVALVSLVDEARQWFKASIGVIRRETPRDVAFCAHTILQHKPLVVRDATRDKRFADNALVRGEPHIRFYTGIPLISPEGMALGTLCVIDRQPRELTAAQMKALEALSRQVLSLLELKRVSIHLAEALNHVKTLQGLLPICAWCRRIRDDEGYWSQVESYFHKATGVEFTHGICPECLKKMHLKSAQKRSVVEPTKIRP